MQPKPTRIISAGALAAGLLLAADSAAAQAYASLPAAAGTAETEGVVRPVPAWNGFCDEQPLECTVDLTEPLEIRLTPQVWRKIVSVNSRVNATVRPLTDCKGLRYIAFLLRHPGRQVHALALLTAADTGQSPLEPVPAGSDSGGHRALAGRARVSVTKSIRRALARIAAVQPALGQHLGATIRTGIRCVYAPDLGVALTWEVRESD